jgi:hypothetical protein
MKKYWIGILMCISLTAFSQDLSETAFDFWEGTWAVSWTEGEGKVGKGMNIIEKILDGKVLQENFEIKEGQNAGFKGKSMSVFNTNTKTWKQAWVDNQGGYFDFTGMIEGDKKMFQTAARNLPDGSTRIQRMVFYDILSDKFTWDWELSNDGGKSWNLQWRINYKRMHNNQNK